MSTSIRKVERVGAAIYRLCCSADTGSRALKTFLSQRHVRHVGWKDKMMCYLLQLIDGMYFVC